ncbi:MAG: prolipoprotein diacylglyceryl transferase, partial [Deltaproteobacteria bacterium]|nr:prolipoprotein diacylglyceryl transferase [Deltaproteobacteria bacterium]
MIPSIHIPTIKIFGLVPIQPFGVLVGIALVVGYFLSRRRARLTGLDPELVADSIVWVSVSGFIVAHLVSVIFYFPERVAEKPWVLLAIWSGLSSFGGFIGGVLGAILFYRKKKLSILEHVDGMIFGMIPGWVFGRMGCSVVHDHPGKVTDFFLAVHCSTAPCSGSPRWIVGETRHDLGLYEMLFTIFLMIVLYSLKNVRPFRGFHPALMLMLYAPVRFLFDYLRIDDKLYMGLTPGQYLAFAIFATGVAVMIYGIRLRRRGIAPGLIPPGLTWPE